MKHPKPDKDTLYQQREAWARWLEKIDKQADSPVFQVIFNPVISMEIKSGKVGNKDTKQV